MFLLGGVCGVVFEKQQTTEIISKISMQMDGLVTPAAVVVTPKARVEKKK